VKISKPGTHLQIRNPRCKDHGTTLLHAGSLAAHSQELEGAERQPSRHARARRRTAIPQSPPGLPKPPSRLFNTSRLAVHSGKRGHPWPASQAQGGRGTDRIVPHQLVVHSCQFPRYSPARNSPGRALLFSLIASRKADFLKTALSSVDKLSRSCVMYLATSFNTCSSRLRKGGTFLAGRGLPSPSR